MQRLIQDWQGVVYNVCLRMLGRPADAEDATQEVFGRVLTRPEAYDQTRAFKPWICRVARNVVLNRLRSEKTRAALRGATPRLLHFVDGKGRQVHHHHSGAI